ncbi:MAG TPA: hypothetical protein VK717_13715 [Opitutaceae bacterium]|jgi:hypothetical protein|nr:hypothetical protein [Opitutaceae bacterium]
MKLRALLLKSLFAVAFLGVMAPLHGQGYGSVDPNQKPSDAEKTPDPKADAKIPGLVIPRANGGFLGLQIDGNESFNLSFYDAKKKPTAPDVASGTIRWTPTGKKGILFVGLEPGSDGVSLSSPKIVQKPWAFKLTLLLFAQGSDNPVETYSVDFSQ